MYPSRLEQTASNGPDNADKHRVIHPCHPLSGYEFEPIRLFNSLGTVRVEFIGPDGKQLYLMRLGRCALVSVRPLR